MGLIGKRAIKAYTEAIELSPTLAEAYNNRGHLKNELGQYQTALADLDRAIELNPTLAMAYNNRGASKFSSSASTKPGRIFRKPLPWPKRRATKTS